MKRCPICQFSYTDETLNFCRRDGAQLINDSAALSDSRATLIKLPPPESDTVPTLADCRYIKTTP